MATFGSRGGCSSGSVAVGMPTVCAAMVARDVRGRDACYVCRGIWRERGQPQVISSDRRRMVTTMDARRQWWLCWWIRKAMELRRQGDGDFLAKALHGF